MMTSLSLVMVKELGMWALIAAVAAASWVVLLIDWLYKLQFTVQHDAQANKMNEEWMKIHGKDTGTPKLGGILIWLTVPAVLFAAFWNVPLMRAVGLVVLLIGFWGFLDDVMVILAKKNLSFRLFQESFEWRLGKLALSFIVNIAAALIMVYIGGLKEISLWGMVIDFHTWWGILLLGGVSSISSYATEIIDGIDALAAGMYTITFIGIAFLMFALPASYITSPTTSAIAVIGVLWGVLLVYLYFNIPPARVYMGAPGAMPMGPIILLLTLKANMVIAAFIFMLPYLVDLASSALQIIAIKFFKRRIFKIAPIHHLFEAIGWPSPKVVMRFWLFNWAIVLLGVVLQLLALG